MKCLIGLLMFFSLGVSANSIDITVEVYVGNKKDSFIREEARGLALFSAMDDLPNIISGTQSLNDGVYSEDIKAIAFASFDATLNFENWDRKAGIYKASYEVSLDIKKTMGLIKDAQKNEEAKKKLEFAVGEIRALAKGGLTRSEVVKLNVISKTITEGIYFKGILAAVKSLQAINLALAYEELNELMDIFVSTAKLTLVKNDLHKGESHFLLTGGIDWDRLQHIKYNMVNYGEIRKAKDICLVKEDGVFQAFDIASQEHEYRDDLTLFDGKRAEFNQIPIVVKHSNQDKYLSRFIDNFKVISCYL